MATTTFAVTGMTCEHCARAVNEELSSLDGVSQVDVHLVPGGESRVMVMSETELSERAVAEALREAGEYRLMR